MASSPVICTFLDDAIRVYWLRDTSCMCLFMMPLMVLANLSKYSSLQPFP